MAALGLLERPQRLRGCRPVRLRRCAVAVTRGVVYGTPPPYARHSHIVSRLAEIGLPVAPAYCWLPHHIFNEDSSTSGLDGEVEPRRGSG
jgi:hypothetical protein